MTLLEHERLAIDGFRGDAPLPTAADEDAWIAFGLRCQLEVARMLRSFDTGPQSKRWTKQDGSPATELEQQVEAHLRRRLARFAPEAVFVGEESGGVLPESGFSVAVDPVDGTWAFLTGIALWTSTFAVFRDGRPWLGFVSNPSSGEVAYNRVGQGSRVLRVDVFGEGDRGWALPEAAPRRADQKPLVLVHPSVGSIDLRQSLDAAWRDGHLGVVRGAGGSPAWGLLEAARGNYVYVNGWHGRAAEPFDLAAAVLVLRGAGGEAVDRDGDPIDPRSHAGLLIAGVDEAARQAVLGWARGS